MGVLDQRTEPLDELAHLVVEVALGLPFQKRLIFRLQLPRHTSKRWRSQNCLASAMSNCIRSCPAAQLSLAGLTLAQQTKVLGEFVAMLILFGSQRRHHR